MPTTAAKTTAFVPAPPLLQRTRSPFTAASAAFSRPLRIALADAPHRACLSPFPPPPPRGRQRCHLHANSPPAASAATSAAPTTQSTAAVPVPAMARTEATGTAAPAAPTRERVLKRAPAVERQSKQPDMYRLYIYNDPFNKRERVIDVLLKTCQGLSFSRAYAAMQEAHENGRGLVLVIAQEIAEHYCACINSEGVLSTIEPDK